MNDEATNLFRSFGYTGTYNDAFKKYLIDLTGNTSGTIDDLLNEYLNSLAFSGTTDDKLFSLCLYRGFSGNLNDVLTNVLKTPVGLGRVPTLKLPLAQNKNLIDTISSTNLITFTRASNATFIGDNGLIQTAGVDVPRFDHNPVTKECLGLLVEEQRTNLLLNSENLSTQTVTVTAVAHALSFYGTGTVVLSGAHSATVNGNGAYPARTVLVFTPAAGSLTLTITGTVQFANLEIGAYATSYIPTTGVAATRAACLTRINTLTPWYNSTEGTLLAEGSRYAAGLTSGIMAGFSQNLIFAQSMYISNDAGFGNTVSFFVFNGGLQADIGGVLSSGVTNNFKAALAYQENNFARSMNGGAVVTDTLGTVPAVSNLTIGSSSWTTGGDNNWSGWIKRIDYWPSRLSNNELQLITK